MSENKSMFLGEKVGVGSTCWEDTALGIGEISRPSEYLGSIAVKCRLVDHIQAL